MTCPDADTLLRDELGELPVHRSEALRAHVEGCGRCREERAAVRRIMADLGPAPSGDDGTDFAAGVLAAARATPQTRRAPDRRRRPRVALVTGTLAAAAVVAIWCLPRRDADVRPLSGVVTARGGAARPTAERPSAEILLVRAGRLQALAGGAVGKSDALAVRVTNPSDSEVQVMAFAWDAAGEVHWLYPAYVDGRTNPQSVPIAAGAKGRLLNDIVQPDSPSAGPLRLVTLVATRPLTVKDVEARLARTAAPERPTADLASLFPGVIAREWSARWEGQP